MWHADYVNPATNSGAVARASLTRLTSQMSSAFAWIVRAARALSRAFVRTYRPVLGRASTANARAQLCLARPGGLVRMEDTCRRGSEERELP